MNIFKRYFAGLGIGLFASIAAVAADPPSPASATVYFNNLATKMPGLQVTLQGVAGQGGSIVWEKGTPVDLRLINDVGNPKNLNVAQAVGTLTNTASIKLEDEPAGAFTINVQGYNSYGKILQFSCTFNFTRGSLTIGGSDQCRDPAIIKIGTITANPNGHSYNVYLNDHG